jgi:hypothetical protein
LSKQRNLSSISEALFFLQNCQKKKLNIWLQKVEDSTYESRTFDIFPQKPNVWPFFRKSLKNQQTCFDFIQKKTLLIFLWRLVGNYSAFSDINLKHVQKKKSDFGQYVPKFPTSWKSWFRFILDKWTLVLNLPWSFDYLTKSNFRLKILPKKSRLKGRNCFWRHFW